MPVHRPRFHRGTVHHANPIRVMELASLNRERLDAMNDEEIAQYLPADSERPSDVAPLVTREDKVRFLLRASEQVNKLGVVKALRMIRRA